MPGPATDSPDTPFAGLTPDRILDALDSVRLRGDGRLLALNSYENRVYQVYLESQVAEAQGSGPPCVVVKFYRAGRWSDAAIREEHEFVCELAAQELPVVAPLAIGEGGALHAFEGFRFAVYPRRGGRAPELEDAETLRWLGRFIGRIHGIGSGRAFAARPSLDVRSHGEEPRDYLLSAAFIPHDLAEVYRGVVDQALGGVRRALERAGERPTLRLHGDFHAGNVLWTDGGPHVVDFDDARMGPAMQDLWMLLSGDPDSMSRQLGHILEGYEGFRSFDPRELHLIEALRTLRIIHYAAWIARRWHDPAFPAAFTWFNTQRYWQDHILALREQIALMEEPPIELHSR